MISGSNDVSDGVFARCLGMLLQHRQAGTGMRTAAVLWTGALQFALIAGQAAEQTQTYASCLAAVDTSRLTVGAVHDAGQVLLVREDRDRPSHVRLALQTQQCAL